MSDELWERIEPLLPAPKSQPLGCHRPRIPNCIAMDTILLVLHHGQAAQEPQQKQQGFLQELQQIAPEQQPPTPRILLHAMSP